MEYEKLSYYQYLRSVFRVAMFGLSVSPAVCRRTHVLFTFIVLACAYWCPTHFALDFCLEHPMLPVSLDCPILIAPSVFSNFYLLTTKTVQIIWREKGGNGIYLRTEFKFATEKSGYYEKGGSVLYCNDLPHIES